MTSPSSSVADHHEAMVHRGFLYRDEEEVVDVCVPFLREGLEADDAVAVVAAKSNIAALRDALGQDAPAVQFEDALSWYQHPVRTIAAYDSFVKAESPRRVRVIAEPVWQGRTPLEVVEWARYESIVNAAFAHSGARVICCYDRRVLHPEILTDARRTHPEIIGGQGPEQSLEYTAPGPFSATCDRRALSPAPATAELLPVERTIWTPRASSSPSGPAGTAWARRASATWSPPSPRWRAPPCATAAPRRSCWVWTQDGDLVCEISGPGHWYPDALWGFTPPAGSETGFGLWGVRMLCDVVQMQADADGTLIRLRTGL